MTRFIYNLFWPIGLLFFLPGYLSKMIRRGGYREKFWQRFGIYDRETRDRLSNEKLTWLHAVSVGEINVALKLANALRALEPDLHCALTTTTTTGFALARKNAPSWIEVSVHAAGLLANYAPRIFCDSADADRSDRSRDLAQSCRRSARAPHSVCIGQRTAVSALGATLSALSIFCRANVPASRSCLCTRTARHRAMGSARNPTEPNPCDRKHQIRC